MNIDPLRLPSDCIQCWSPTRPPLVIESLGTVPLGNCYRKFGFRITSFDRLNAEKLNGLFKLGFLGYGQTFKVESQHDGKEDAALVDEVPAHVFSKRLNKVLDDVPAIHERTGQPLGTHKYPYYVYECWAFCDSGD